MAAIEQLHREVLKVFTVYALTVALEIPQVAYFYFLMNSLDKIEGWKFGPPTFYLPLL